LQASRQVLEAVYGPAHAAVKEMEAKIAQAREEARAKVPIHQQVREANLAVADKHKECQAQEKVVKQLEQQVNALHEKLAKARAVASKLEDELEVLEHTRDQLEDPGSLRTQQVISRATFAKACGLSPSTLPSGSQAAARFDGLLAELNKLIHVNIDLTGDGDGPVVEEVVEDAKMDEEEERKRRRRQEAPPAESNAGAAGNGEKTAEELAARAAALEAAARLKEEKQQG
jgi:predicted RNase H-like nuclease (RuvC/YqgF family)